MAPKNKESTKPAINRPPISDSSLMYVPEDVLEGFHERVETGIDWTLLESGARHHRNTCKKEDLPTITFSKALKAKINNSVLHGFLDKHSGLTLQQNWEFLLPATLWDNEKFATDEGKVCFHNANCITDDLVKLVKKAVKEDSRKVLRRDFKMIHTLRVNSSQMTDLDEGLMAFKELISLNLCGNHLTTIDTSFVPPTLRSLELQANRIHSIDDFAESLPADLLYLGLGRNLFTSETVLGLSRLPYKLTVLDLSDNDIYHLEPVLEAVSLLPYLTSLSLAGNPCSVCSGYARTTLIKLVRLRWLDCREILPTDRPTEPIETHPDDLRSTYFNFVVYRVMAAPQPPKAEKGAATTFHIELEIPLLDAVRRKFLMFRSNESLIEMLPPPEDDEWGFPTGPVPTPLQESKVAMGEETESQGTNIFDHMVYINPREIHNFTTFESNRIQWSKIMNFQEPLVRIFCPDLIALRDTFRSAITCRLVYSVTYSPGKASRADKKSTQALRMPGEMRVVIATMRCSLRAVDWSQPYQHFHWDDSLGTDDAIHWGDGDLSVLQYSQTPVKISKGKSDSAEIGSRQTTPENLTCHFGVGIDTLRNQ